MSKKLVTTITLPEIVRNLPTEPASDWEGRYASVEHSSTTYALGGEVFFNQRRDKGVAVRHAITGEVLREYVAAGLSEIQVWVEPANEWRIFVLHQGLELDLESSPWETTWVWQAGNRLLLPLNAEHLKTYSDGYIDIHFERSTPCPLLVEYCDAHGVTQPPIEEVDACHDRNTYDGFVGAFLRISDLYAYGVLPNNAPEVSLVGGVRGARDALICYLSDETKVRLPSIWKK